MAENEERVGEVRQELPSSVRIIPLFKKKCPICGTEFEGPKRQKYDRPACASVAYDRRHPASRKARTLRYQQKRRQHEKQRPPGESGA